MGLVFTILYIFVGSLVGRAVYLKKKPRERGRYEDDYSILFGWLAGTLWPLYLMVLPGLLLADRFFTE